MLEINVNSNEVSAVLAQIVRKTRNLRPVMDSVGQELSNRVSGRFETETDPNGQKWAPWAESTREEYPKDGHGRILERYGDMLHSLNHQADTSSVRVSFGAVAGKAGDAYAVYHEFGTERMPRRGLLTADPEQGTLGAGDEAAVLDILEIWLSDLSKS